MIKHKLQDIFDDLDDIDIIIHQANCQNVMGSGIAKSLKDKFPQVYKVDTEAAIKGTNILGGISVAANTNGPMVINMYSQNKYYPRNIKHTDYYAFRICLLRVKIKALLYMGNNTKIAIPYKIGCDLAGGDWEIVKKIIEDELHNMNVTIYYLPKYKDDYENL